MRILITGGTGSLGQALISRWREKHELTILSRNPHKQQMVQEKYSLEPSAFVLADICDYEAVKAACKDQDFLIHAAALKVVSQGEQFPFEYHRVNAIGSMVVAQAWAESNLDSKGALYINSDKAVAPINFYGATKRIGETFFINNGHMSLRYGNVVASEGSFIHKWKRALSQGQPIEVRFPYPTRFFLSFEQALDLIDEVIEYRQPGIYIPLRLRAFNIYDVSRVFVTSDAQICARPLEPGEKQHEVLVQEREKVRSVSPTLGIIEQGEHKSDGLEPEIFCSKTAMRIPASEILAALNIAKPQKVYT
jgi:FlaA1/EpsC-like NDP-sugar epimerase